MTEESHPELGSGALREALADLQKLLGAATVRFTRDHGEPNPSLAIPYEVVFACEQWTRVLNQMVLALSLSSPIEQRGEIYRLGVTALAAMIRCEYPDFDENHVSESLARIASRAQASSEIREALEQAAQEASNIIEALGDTHRGAEMSERRLCEKLDRDTQQWNAAFPNKPPRTMKCGYPLPCPWHTVIIDTAGPRVHIPHAAGLSQGQRKRVRALAVQISDGLEDEERRGEAKGGV